MSISKLNSTNEPAMTASELIQALNDLRDELVRTSLMVKDYRFYLDTVWSGSTAQIARKIIEKVKCE